MKIGRINLLLGALLGLLGLLAFSGLWQAPTAHPPLTGLNPAQLQSLRISQGVERRLAFQRQGDGWRMLEPFPGKANARKLNDLARIAQAPSLRRFDLAQADSAELGFADPPLRLELDSLTLEFGGIEPIRMRRYVRIGQQVHLIEDRFQHHLLADAAAFAAPPALPPR
jgi:hypothetical protein